MVNGGPKQRSHEVFISYSRAKDVKHARRVRDLLNERGINVFLDEHDIEPGSPFPEDLADALLSAKVVLVFASNDYFERPWCVSEFNVAVASYESNDARDFDEHRMIAHVVVAWPTDEESERIAAHLPPPLAVASGPSSEDADLIAEIVAQRINEQNSTLGERLSSDSEAVRILRRGGAIPQAGNLTGVPGYFRLLPDSLGDRFVGREKTLWEVFKSLGAGRGGDVAARSCSLEGGGGTGKTQIAAEYAWRYGGRFYPGGIVWIDASEDDQDLLSDFSGVLSAFGVEVTFANQNVELHERLDTLSKRVEAVARTAAERGPVLWIVDNVPEASGKSPPQTIERWCPAKRDVTLLFTSRRTGLKRVDHNVQVEPLSTEASIDLLTCRGMDRKSLAEAQWQTIVHWVGCLPLALRILQVSLEDGFITPEETLGKALNQEPAVALDAEMEALHDEIAEDYVQGVAETFNVAYGNLAREPALAQVAHVVSRLAPVAIPETELLRLAPTKTLALLRKRSWIQRSRWVEGERHWTMHRVVASFLRCKSIAPDAEFADALRWLHTIRPTNPAYALHLRKLARDIGISLYPAVPQQSQAVEQAKILGADVVLQRLDDPSANGARFLAAQLLQAMDATEPVVERLGELYSVSDQTTATNIASFLHGMPYSARAAELFIKLLKDHRPDVRYKALIHASQSARADLLAVPLLDAIMAKDDDLGEVAITGYEILFANAVQFLDSAFSRIVEYLNQGTLKQCDRALQLIGRLVRCYVDRLPRGHFSYAELLERLMRCTKEDHDLGIALRAAGELGLIDDEVTYVSLAAPLKQEIQSVTQRHIQILGEYLSEAQRLPALRDITMNWLDDGRLALSMSGVGEKKPRRPERYLPLVRVVTDAMDEDQRRSGLQELLRTISGKEALMHTIYDLLDTQADVMVADIAEAVIRIDGDFESGYWWRGQVRERRNQFDDAISDYTRIIELMPQFVDAFYRRALLLARNGEADSALADLDAVLKLEPENVSALHDRALLRYQQGNNDEAVNDLDAFIAIRPSEPLAYHLRAGALLNSGRLHEALDSENRAIELDGSVAEYWLFRANIRHGLGDTAAALTDAERACELDPSDVRATEWRDHLRVVASQKETGKNLGAC
jgi:tetratricopeptide (TPR) repeat protein